MYPSIEYREFEFALSVMYLKNVFCSVPEDKEIFEIFRVSSNGNAHRKRFSSISMQ